MGTNGEDSPSINSTFTWKFKQLISQTPFPINIDEESDNEIEYEDERKEQKR